VFTDVSTTATGAWQVEDLGDAQPINTLAQLYAVIEDAAGQRSVVNHEDGINSVLMGQWTPWRIQLSDLTGVDLSRVKTLSIGVGNTDLNGTGLLLIDDIELQHKADQLDECQVFFTSDNGALWPSVCEYGMIPSPSWF
jgi:hypothetical protein